MQQLGGALGLATLFTLALHYGNGLFNDMMQQAAASNVPVDQQFIAQVRLVAFTHGASRGFMLAGGLLFAAGIVAFFFNRIHHLDMAQAHTPTPVQHPGRPGAQEPSGTAAGEPAGQPTG